MASLGTDADDYKLDGVRVRTYPVNRIPSRAELKGEDVHAGFDQFCRILEEERPLIYHQHSWSRGLGGAHLQAARSAGLKTVLTVHTATNICLRGSMMRFGNIACDGKIAPPICGACWCHERGAPKLLARSIGSIPPRLSGRLEQFVPQSRVSTALSARMLGERRRSDFDRMVENADRIVAVCEWVLAALRLNGVPEYKLQLSRQGIGADFSRDAARVNSISRPRSEGPFQLLYLGRWHPAKGMDVLVDAVTSIPDEIPVALTLHGVGDGPEELRYARYIGQRAKGDVRVRIEPPIPRSQLAETLSRADALAVPSVGLETGPLVVLKPRPSACRSSALDWAELPS